MASLDVPQSWLGGTYSQVSEQDGMTNLKRLRLAEIFSPARSWHIRK